MDRRICVDDPDFSERIRELLNSTDADVDGESSSDEVDDSDDDPDYVSSRARKEDTLTASDIDSESDNDDVLLEEEVTGDFLEQGNNSPSYFFERMKKAEHGPPNAKVHLLLNR